MKSAFRFRLYPNRRQERKLLRMVVAARRLWNDALVHRKRRWEEKRLSTSYSQQCWIFTAERHADPLLGGLYSQAGQEILKRLDKAFKAFFEGRARYPRFKKFSASGSFTYPQAYNGSVKPDVARKRLFLSKVGNIKVVFHREMPPSERLKTCTMVREPNGEWYASLMYEDDVQIPEPVKAFTSPLGIDLGLKSLMATTDGVKIPHPQFLRKAERRLKSLQRKLSRTRKGSKNRKKARRRLAIQSSKVARQRADFNHKLSAELVRKHDLVAFEDLKVRNMVSNHALAKSIADAGWGQLRSFSEYKAARSAKLVVRVPPAYSTQECCFCGALNQTPLRVRVFDCRGCKRTVDRDFNAAWIVLKRGLAQVGQDMPELKPVETAPLPAPATGRANPAGEAGTIRDGNHATQQEARRWKLTTFSCGRMSRPNRRLPEVVGELPFFHVPALVALGPVASLLHRPAAVAAQGVNDPHPVVIDREVDDAVHRAMDSAPDYVTQLDRRWPPHSPARLP
ncbi:MAG: transposase [Nitrososphaerales archaeon]|nr:transposase [Nitrososphaerales archaeon]